jgi:hypothetical protein
LRPEQFLHEGGLLHARYLSRVQQASLNFDICQRWFHGRTSFRPSREPIYPAKYGVDAIEYGQAKEFVCRHHYSGTFSPSIRSFGLFRQVDAASRSKLVGVATFAPASNPNSIRKWSGLPNEAGAELARFVLLEEEPGNAESWFLARALRGFKQARPGVQIVLSYSDPVPRTTLAGAFTLRGHHGCIYASTNALYLGRASPKTQFVNAEGQVIANRILSKLRNGEVGRRYAEKALTEATGITREDGEAPNSFVERALACLRAHRHPGNHLYAFPLGQDRREKNAVLSLPVLQAHSRPLSEYPKRADPVPQAPNAQFSRARAK